MAGTSASGASTPAIFRRSARSTRGATAACAGAALLSLLSSSARLAHGARFFNGSPRREAFAPPPSFLTVTPLLHHGISATKDAAAWRCDPRAGRGGLGCRVASHRGLLRVLQLRGGATARGCSSAGQSGGVGAASQEGETRLELRIDDGPFTLFLSIPSQRADNTRAGTSLSGRPLDNLLSETCVGSGRDVGDRGSNRGSCRRGRRGAATLPLVLFLPPPVLLPSSSSSRGENSDP